MTHGLMAKESLYLGNCAMLNRAMAILHPRKKQYREELAPTFDTGRS